MNALIIETAFLGDAIVSLSLAHAIKQLDPDSTVSYVVRPDAGEVISASPDVARAIAFDKHGAESGLAGIHTKAAQIDDFKFDTLFLLHGSRRSQSLASRLTIPVKVGFEGMTHATLTHTVKDAGWNNRYERAVLPLRAIDPNARLDILPKIVPPRTPEFDAFFNRFDIAVALAPGSAWETKKWGDDKFFALAIALAAKNIGIVVIGGKDEQAVGSKIETAASGNVLDLTGRVSFLTSMSAIARSSLLVANDSAPTHAAVAVGTKVFTLFGPTVPAFGFAPPGGSGEAIEVPGLWCRPCTPHGSHTCPIYTHECMKRLSVENVLEHMANEMSWNANEISRND